MNTIHDIWYKCCFLLYNLLSFLILMWINDLACSTESTEYIIAINDLACSTESTEYIIAILWLSESCKYFMYVQDRNKFNNKEKLQKCGRNETMGTTNFDLTPDKYGELERNEKNCNCLLFWNLQKWPLTCMYQFPNMLPNTVQVSYYWPSASYRDVLCHLGTRLVDRWLINHIHCEIIFISETSQS